MFILPKDFIIYKIIIQNTQSINRNCINHQWLPIFSAHHKELINTPTMNTFAEMMLQKLCAHARLIRFLSCILAFGGCSSLLFTVGLHIYMTNVVLTAKRNVMKKSSCRGMFTKLCVKFPNLRSISSAWIYIHWRQPYKWWLYRIEYSCFFSLFNSMITYRKLGGVRVERGRRGCTGQRGVRRRRHPVRRTALACTCKGGIQVKMRRFFYYNSIWQMIVIGLLSGYQHCE